MFVARRLAILAIAAVLGACASKGKGRPASDLTPPTTLTVENQGFADMNIYVVRSTQRIRIGTVTGNSKQTFVLPSNLIFGATPLRFLADPIGGRRSPVSDEITVSPGDNIRLVIPPG